MKPNEFWNCEYREVVKYCNMNYIRNIEDMKQSIMIEEAMSDKLIKADAMSTKKPKILSMKEKFKKLF